MSLLLKKVTVANRLSVTLKPRLFLVQTRTILSVRHQFPLFSIGFDIDSLDPDYDAYKHGAFLEKSTRFLKQKAAEGPGRR